MPSPDSETTSADVTTPAGPNLRGLSPMDFESISLAARTQCHVMDHFLIGLIKQSLKCSGLLGSANCKPLAALSLNFVLSLA